MQAYGRRLLLRDTSRAATQVFSRHASLTGAITRGIRKTQRGVETAFEGVRNNRSDDARERAPWNSRPEGRYGGSTGKDRGWQGDVEHFGRERSRSTREEGGFEGSESRPRQSYGGSTDRGGHGGGGFNRDNADRRVRYEERKGGFRERGPPPNRDGPNREERRRAQFGKPFSGKPHHDSEFMERHISQDRGSYDRSSTATARRERTSPRYEAEAEEENLFDEEYSDPSGGGWKAEDVEKEWEGRSPKFQPEFTRAREMARMSRGDREYKPRTNGGQTGGRSFPDRYGKNNERGASGRDGVEQAQEGFRRSRPSGDHFIPRDDTSPQYRRTNREESMEDLDEDVEMPSLEQRRNKFRPARKLERSIIDVETTSKISTTAPASVPFTTAASTFLYGTFSVQEAIRAGRRTLYTLYIYRGQSIDAPTTPESYHLISKLALAQGCTIKEISGEGWSRLLNKMTASRAHNGWVLEASEIPKLPVTSLNRIDAPSSTFEVNLGHQSAEELAINAPIMQPGSSPNSGIAAIPTAAGKRRFPLLLLLDRIMDPGNLGAIVRSAHFLGVDALIMLEHNTAPFNAITLKVAAGAAEYLPILMVKNEHDLVKSSKKNGWRFFAAVSPTSEGAIKANEKDVASALGKGPCVLMLGSEGEGLRSHLQKLADGVASIRNARGEHAGIDSLNVSVASALLCQEFLRGPHEVAGGEEVLETSHALGDLMVIDSIKEHGEGESEAEMVERQEEKVF
jgi:tRNA G18 (ribose-2'-O)-methylase SpoU